MAEDESEVVDAAPFVCDLGAEGAADEGRVVCFWASPVADAGVSGKGVLAFSVGADVGAGEPFADGAVGVCCNGTFQNVWNG